MKYVRHGAVVEFIRAKCASRCVTLFRPAWLSVGLALALSWPASGCAQTIAKLLDAADVKAEDDEFLEYKRIKALSSGQIDEAKMARIREILQDKNERDLQELTELVNAGDISIFGNSNLLEAFQWILSVQERTLGAANPKAARTARTLGIMYWAERYYPKVKRYLEESLPGSEPQLQALAQTKKDFAPRDYEVCLALGYLSELALREGNFDSAEAYQQRLLNIYRTQKDASAEAGSEIYLARIAHVRGDRSAARAHYNAAEKKFAEKGGGNLEERERLSYGLSLLYIDAGQAGNAAREARKLWQAYQLRFQEVISQQESIALIVLGNLEPYSLAVALGDTPQLAQLILDWKGCVLETVLALRQMEKAVGSGGMFSPLGQLRTAQQYLAFRESMSPELRSKLSREKAEYREKIKRMPIPDAQKQALLRDAEDEQAKVGRLTAELDAERVSDPRVSTSPAKLSNVLERGQVLVEYLRYYQYLGNARWQRAYGAMIFSRGNEPVWVPLERVTNLDALITKLRQEISAGNPGGSPALRTMLRETCDAVWTPVAKALPGGAKDVVIGPDGLISFLPFAALLDSRGQFLAESFRFSFVTSGRDLLRRPATRNTGTFVLFGDPNFERTLASAKGTATAGKPAPALTIAQQRLLEEAGFSSLEALPGSGAECRRLADLFKEQGVGLTLKTGAAASEETLRNVRSPRGLHLATHGAFVSAQMPKPFASLFPEQASQRSVIFLAGAQSTLHDLAQRSGDALGGQTTQKQLEPPLSERASDDGIVTAKEISDLPLEGTWLVTLSACETALGQVRAGEGVIGLRRSFVEAGARNLLMSLWLVADETTPDMMIEFYGRALETNDLPRAWAVTQLNWLRKLSAGDNLFKAVFNAGAFVLCRQGNENSGAGQ
jgi:CHAT domain-containing protein